jgi:hypothetical protein
VVGSVLVDSRCGSESWAGSSVRLMSDMMGKVSVMSV